jgi:hypothetical protein
MKNKNNLTEEQVNELFEQTWHKDRSTIQSALDKLKEQMTEKEDWAINGITYTKLIELLTKQTAQILEFYKIVKKDPKEESSKINEEDMEKIYDEIKNEKLKEEN